MGGTHTPIIVLVPNSYLQSEFGEKKTLFSLSFLNNLIS